MLKIEVTTCFVVTLLLTATPAVADAARELVRCELEAEHLYPAPNNKGFGKWPERQANLRKRAENTETCMRAAGYSVTADAPPQDLRKLYEDPDELMHGPSGNLYRDADWNGICLDNEWDVRTQERLSANCYQSDSWWRPWLGQ